MSKYDIVITFFTIIYGLMLADLFLSLHKLIRSKNKVRWHWLPLLSAWYLFLIILKNWWDLYSFQGVAESMNILFFIAYGHLLLLLFLMASTALPDIIDENSIELKNYYFNNRRYFWGLMTSVVILSSVITFLNRINGVSQVNIYNLFGGVVFIALLIVMSISKKYWVHSVLLVLFVLETILEILNKA